MSASSRRTFIQATAAASLVATSGKTGHAESRKADTLVSALEYQRSPVPLPFDPKSLKGLSERLIQSHWENNYSGAVKALNLIRGRLVPALGDANTPPYVYNDLKREHLLRTGSVVLHELYFENLGGDGKAAAETRSMLARAFGTFDAWEAEFRKIGQGLGGGSGWVVLGYNQHLGLLENYWLADHGSNPPHTRPILVMDMYEHAYHLDYGAAAAKYIDAFFANIHWDRAGKRLSASA